MPSLKKNWIYKVYTYNTLQLSDSLFKKIFFYLIVILLKNKNINSPFFPTQIAVKVAL